MISGRAGKTLAGLSLTLGIKADTLLDHLLDGVLANASKSTRERKKLIAAIRAGKNRHNARLARLECKADRAYAEEVKNGLRRPLPSRIIIPMDRITTVRMVPTLKAA